LKNFLVISISLSRSAGVLPNKARSSAKNTAEIFREPKDPPQLEELSSEPRLLIKRANRRGERLHPEIKVIYFEKFI
jgi:hypothetical protein